MYTVMSSEKHLNIIAFDVPFPPDYGGVIDIFYKTKALIDAGVKVHLHCFEYGRLPSNELSKICEAVYYYPRRTTKSLLFNTLPYIVLSRESDELKRNLLQNNFPILMEGLHCTFLLNDEEFKSRKIIVRAHNVEHDYYSNLAKVESNIFKRYYFYNEAGKLEKYEAVLNYASGIASISPNDTNYFSGHYKNVNYIPAFHPNTKVTSREGKGDFALYHGNLSVSENNEAALYLITKVFDGLSYPLVIAGSKPSDELRAAIKESKNTTLKDNLSPEQIHLLIADAHCNILPTFQPTGIKLKLLSALFAGRFCIVNSPMVDNTGLEKLCIIADSSNEMKGKIKEVFQKQFEAPDAAQRESVLRENFSNAKNAQKLIKLLF
jgi:hypothetical protein